MLNKMFAVVAAVMVCAFLLTTGCSTGLVKDKLNIETQSKPSEKETKEITKKALFEFLNLSENREGLNLEIYNTIYLLYKVVDIIIEEEKPMEIDFASDKMVNIKDAFGVERQAWEVNVKATLDMLYNLEFSNKTIKLYSQIEDVEAKVFMYKDKKWETIVKVTKREKIKGEWFDYGQSK